MKTGSRTTGTLRNPFLLLIGLLLIGGLVGGTYLLFGRSGEGRRGYDLVMVERGQISATINAGGSIQPDRLAELSFALSGTVAEVLVVPGDPVTAGQPLARLDTRSLELEVERAEAALLQARANYNRLANQVTPQDLAQAEAQLAQSRGQYEQVVGSVTPQDLTAARAQLNQARATLAQLAAGPQADELRVAQARRDEAHAVLAQLEAGPDPNQVAAAQAQYDQALANLETQRDNLSAVKTRAEAQMEVAANLVRDAQDEYQRVYWINRNLEQSGREVSLWLQNREDEAWRAVENAQFQLDQARVAYDQARQAEIDGLAAAEAQVRSSEANLAIVRAGPGAAQLAGARSQVAQAEATLNQLLAGADSAELAAARNQVAQAEAQLARLQGQQRNGSLAAAEAVVQAAQAGLDRVAAGPGGDELAAAQAQVAQAETNLKQARLNLERATLSAPFAGTVTTLNLVEGGMPPLTGPAVILADLDNYHVTVTVDEIDVAQLLIGQSVVLTLDALPDLQLAGSVAAISPLAVNRTGVTAYDVRVAIAGGDSRVRPGMSANVEITVAQKDNALIVPLRAVRAEGVQLVVDIPENPTVCQLDPAGWPLEPPALRAVPIMLGLGNDEFTELLPGVVDAGTCIYVEGFDARLSLMQGTTMPSLRERRQSR